MWYNLDTSKQRVNLNFCAKNQIFFEIFLKIYFFKEMVWQIVNKVDTEKARKIPLWVRSPFIEMEGLFREGDGEAFRVHAQENGIEGYEAMIETVKYSALAPSPRVIKTHLPIDMLPPKLLDTCKVIFVCRNPKDTCVSFYHHYNNFPEYQFKGDFKDFAQLFIDGHLEMGSYWTMLKVRIAKLFEFSR